MKNIALFVFLCAVTVLVAAGCKQEGGSTTGTETNAAPSTTTTNK